MPAERAAEGLHAQPHTLPWSQLAHADAMLSHSAAALRYADCPVDEEAANHRALGSGCHHAPDAEPMCECAPAATFTILSQGFSVCPGVDEPET